MWEVVILVRTLDDARPSTSNIQVRGSHWVVVPFVSSASGRRTHACASKTTAVGATQPLDVGRWMLNVGR